MNAENFFPSNSWTPLGRLECIFWTVKTLLWLIFIQQKTNPWGAFGRRIKSMLAYFWHLKGQFLLVGILSLELNSAIKSMPAMSKVSQHTFYLTAKRAPGGTVSYKSYSKKHYQHLFDIIGIAVVLRLDYSVTVRRSALWLANAQMRDSKSLSWSRMFTDSLFCPGLPLRHNCTFLVYIAHDYYFFFAF